MSWNISPVDKGGLLYILALESVVLILNIVPLKAETKTKGLMGMFPREHGEKKYKVDLR